MRIGREGIRRIVNEVLAAKPHLSSSELAARCGISRQAAHRHLRAFVASGELERAGRGPGAHYRRASTAGEVRLTYARKGLTEDTVWADALKRVPVLTDIPDNADRILHYALTELVNNAVDHSGGNRVELVFASSKEPLVFEVIDDGVGIFEHVRQRLRLESAMAALGELSKGKVTTDPKRHTGEGIFFVSKIADFLVIESGRLAWKVDNLRADTSVANVPPRRGTRARFEVSRAKRRALKEVFDEYTKDYEFSKTRIIVKLFAIGVRFVSRSEAKRLLHGLERFRDVVLDFTGVQEVGQGFADEVFRVWANEHPDVTLAPINMAGAVEFMVKRARSGGVDRPR